MTDATDDPAAGPDSADAPLGDALGQRYLAYALSTIMDRALPDARDGLKPVQRRILYAMRALNLRAGAPFRKSAKIAGDVMGNYHPHGEGAIYDAMVRLAQPFVMRTPLVEGQGNFGNIDGDNAAASRYTEARLSAAAEALLAGLDEDAVDYRDNYDGTRTEPAVLPAAFPNLLANGASGIAVGMATSIPPHNLHELVAAARALIADPETDSRALMAHLPGPDFPTGGVIVEPAGEIARAYETGRGGIRLRARWHREELGRGQWQIVVTEIPAQVQKARLIERMAELMAAKKLPLLADLRDESAEDVRIVLEPKSRGVAPDALMAALFRLSDLELRISLNMNVLTDGRTPRVCSLAELLRLFLDHRREVLLRRSRHRLGRIDARLEVLEGLIVAFLNLDEVIAIIRAEDEPRPVLMDRFDLSEVQAEAILNTRLRALRRLEEMALRTERDDLTRERAAIGDLLVDPAAQWAWIDAELAETGERFADPRRTGFAEAGEAAEVPLEAMVDRAPVTVVLSRLGWIRTLKGHADPAGDLKYKDGDGPGFFLHAETTDRLVMVGSNGRAHTLKVAELPGGRGMGEPVRLSADLPNEAGVVALLVHRAGQKLLLASSAGDGFVLPAEAALAQTRAGKQVMTLRGDARLVVCRPVTGDHVAVVGENRKMLVFSLAELPEMARGKGVRVQKYRDGGLSDAVTVNWADGLSWTERGGRTRRESDLTEWLGKRATAGRMAPRGFPRDNRFG